MSYLNRMKSRTHKKKPLLHHATPLSCRVLTCLSWSTFPACPRARYLACGHSVSFRNRCACHQSAEILSSHRELHVILSYRSAPRRLALRRSISPLSFARILKMDYDGGRRLILEVLNPSFWDYLKPNPLFHIHLWVN
jgi:hypothetical protein